MMKTRTILRIVGVAAFAVAGTTLAQEQAPPGPPAEDSDLVFEREVFDYPTFQRRNPFVPLLSNRDGPRYEQMRLRGIIFSADSEGSVALLSAGATSQRLRAGQSWGNVRILEVRKSEVLVEVEEFGMTEQHVMTMQTQGQGGS
jgi:type II secretory pathway component PulC